MPMSRQECLEQEPYMSELRGQVYSLARKITEMNKQSGLRQEIMAIEECSELTIELQKLSKSLTKNLRDKGNTDEIVEESCDIFCSVYALLVRMGVSDETILVKMRAKYLRALTRFEDHGEL